MANRNSSLKPDRIQKQINALDLIAKKLLNTINSGYQERESLSAQDSKIQSILADELDFNKGVSNGSIIDFISANRPQKDQNTQDSRYNTEDMFTKDVGDIYSYFQDMYKNRFIEISDLKFIAKLIPGIGEAVKATLDAIVSADDISSSITRNLVFGSNLTESEKVAVTQEIERIERDEKLLKKLKNIVYKKTLVTGMYYVYHVPYAELFEEYDFRLKNGKIDRDGHINANAVKGNIAKRTANANAGFVMNNASEDSSSYYAANGTKMIDIAMESLSDTVDSMHYLSSAEKKNVKNSLSDLPFTVHIEDSPYLSSAIEAAIDYTNLDNARLSPYYKELYGGVREIDNIDTEGSYDGSKMRTRRASKFNLSGTYIKYIDAKHMIPIRVYNTLIGYYYVHNQASAKKAQRATATTPRETSITSPGVSIFSSANMSEKKREQVMNDIVDSIAEGILSNFSTKLVSKYAEHKKLIADCLIANGLINNDYSIQFIPVEYVTPFLINEDENGNGESMLADSLFPAKLLSSYVINKLLTYMNKSSNKTIAHVGKGPINVSQNNHIQRVLRMLQQTNITFNDLLSTNLVFSKFSRDSNVQLPRAKNGDKLVEFEIQEGQQVDMKTDMEEWLEKQAIMGTGVPSTIIEFVDAADYSRSLITANIKHAARVACFQSDLEESTTQLYKALILGSSLTDDLKKKAVASFEFKLATPRVLSNANIGEFVDTLDRTAETVSTILSALDENAQDNDKDAVKVRLEFKKLFVQKFSPFMNWGDLDELMKRATLNVKGKKDYDKPKSEGAEDDTQF